MKLEKRIKSIRQKYNFNGFSGPRKMSKMQWHKSFRSANPLQSRKWPETIEQLFVLSRAWGSSKDFHPLATRNTQTILLRAHAGLSGSSILMCAAYVISSCVCVCTSVCVCVVSALPKCT